MKKKFLFIFFVWSTAAIWPLLPTPSPAQPCEVIAAHDGDSLRIRQPDGRSVSVRLYGVDCPELGQPYGDAARDLTERLVGQVVDVQPTGGRSWGRDVAVIVLSDGCTLQAALVEAGLAWVDGRFCHSSECDGWRQAQEQAREARRGLWADEGAVPPWVWRRAKK
ncbi:thermonuclease family protein [Desulfovibrio piger]|uniref:thermonuclease family protein n=1 Tax=Desulfovibrio piger TaxID=901 RepID=UPI0026EFCB4F|nr:thermonuclease family protein [Desulfovibrio piger]